MSTCEKCWSDARDIGDIAENYARRAAEIEKAEATR